MTRPRWPDVRAAAIALAIGFALVDGCPLPAPGDERPWQRGYVAAVRPVQRAVLAPVAWVPRTLRFSQRWALFQAAPSARYRFEVEGRRAGMWTPLYLAGTAHAAYAELLEDRHVQGVWNPTRRTSARYHAFASWFTAYVLAADPTLDAVRIRHHPIALDRGAVAPAGPPVFDYARERR